MFAHASMNRIYCLVWSEVLRAWVAVAENSRGRGKRGGRRALLAPAFAALGIGAAHAATPPPARAALPTRGQVVAGDATINTNGNAMTVHQGSTRVAIDWQTFNLGSQASVRLVQPSASSIALNRVLDTQASQVFGRISANGQVFLTNPNGIVFGKSASVDVGGLVAATHSMSNADFMVGSTTFSRNSATGSVINEGDLHASLGGYIALLAPDVRNSGVVIAEAGTVALASGEAVSLQFDGNNSLASVAVTPSAIAALVENGNAVLAPGGRIILAAQAADRLQGGGVNNSGRLEANGLSSDGGRIVLTASDALSHTGTIAANAAPGSAGHGGSVVAIAFIGELVGLNYFGQINSTYATGDVTGTQDVGGLVGFNQNAGGAGSAIRNSYARGNAHAASGGVGGLVGTNGSIVENSYSTGTATVEENGTAVAGGLIGVMYEDGGQPTGTITESFWDKQTSHLTVSAAVRP